MRLALIVMLVMLVASCGGAADFACQADDQCLRYGLTADIPILDPFHAEAAEAGMIFRQIYDTLIYRRADNHVFVPGLATDWTVSPDGLIYTFSLRADVVFHDGSRFDAAAVGRNIERIFDPAISQSRARELLGPLSQYEVAGDHLIRLIMASPYPGLLDSLSQPYLGIASPAALDSYDRLRFQFHQAGTGPFQLDEYLPGERIVLRRFDGYRVSPTIYAPLSGDEITRVEFALGAGREADALSVLSDSLDVLDGLSPVAAQNLAANSLVQVLPVDIPGLSSLFLFNTAREHLDNRAVRLALLLATNRVAISDQVYFNFSPVAWAPLSTSTGLSHTGYVDQFAHDLPAARALLADAGYGNSDGEPLTLRALVPPWGGLPDAAAMLQRQWQDLGVRLEIEPVPGRTRMRNLIQRGEYDLIPVDGYGIDPNVLARAFLADSLYSASRAQDEELQELLLNILHTADGQARRALVYDAQARMMEGALILPVREPVRLTAARADLRNLRFDAYGFYPLLYNTSIADA